MKITSIVFNHGVSSIKLENGKVFLRAFGTTMNNQKMHYSWQEVKIQDLKPDVQKALKKFI